MNVWSGSKVSRNRSEKFFLDRSHFKKRVKERWGENVDNFLYQKIIDTIITGKKSEYIEMHFHRGRSTKSRSVHIIKVKNLILKVIYNIRQKSLITALPLKSNDIKYYEYRKSLIKINSLYKNCFMNV